MAALAVSTLAAASLIRGSRAVRLGRARLRAQAGRPCFFFRHDPSLEGIMRLGDGLLNDLPVRDTSRQVRNSHQEAVAILVGEWFDANGIVLQSYCAASINRTNRRIRGQSCANRDPQSRSHDNSRFNQAACQVFKEC